MIKENHLSTYKMTLTVKTPVFIGSGSKLAKNEYIFNPKNKTVSFLDENKFFELLVRKKLIDSYERFILGNNYKLYEFFRDNKISQDEINGICSNILRVRGIMSDDSYLRDLHRFMRNSENKAYVPGSSVKGALRTVLLTALILDDKNKGDVIDEGKYFNTLDLNIKKNKDGTINKNDAVNSIMRGISVSDSFTISDSQMTLVGKMDLSRDGYINRINLIRESAEEGTKIECYITFDNSVLKNKITLQTLKKAISVYNAYYKTTYLSMFPNFQKNKEMITDTSLILGGGSGFFGKSVIYPFLGKDKAIDKLSNKIFAKGFPQHKHWQDVDYGISPRMLKCTDSSGELVHMGICEVEFE